jgi:hypothetical protein
MTGSPYPPPTYGYGYPPYGYQSTNGMAIASLILSAVGWVVCIGPILGIIFGFVGLSQIRQSEGRQSGSGLAKAGIIVGFAVIAIFILLVVLGSINNHNSSNG